MQANTLTARYCGLCPVRIQEALFIGRSIERLRRFQKVVDEIKNNGYNVSESFTDEQVYTDVATSRQCCYCGGNGD